MNRTKILLVDNHQLIRQSLRSFLNDQINFEVVGQASQGEEALEIMKTMELDVVIIDIDMEAMNGIECAKIINQLYPEVKIIALTTLNDSKHIRDMLQAGASAYLLKNCTIEELTTAITTVISGGSYYSPEVTQTIMRQLKGKNLPFSNGTYTIPITPREKEILQLIVREYSNQEVADDLSISIRTVEAHKRNIIGKTGCKNTAGLVVYALKNHV